MNLNEAAAHLPGSVFEGYRCKVFIIDDAGRHIVAAKKITDAYKIVAEMACYESVEDYVREEEPSIRECSPYEEIRVDMTEHVVLPKLSRADLGDEHDWPDGVRIEATVIVRGFAQDWMHRDWTGLIGTTEV